MNVNHEIESLVEPAIDQRDLEAQAAIEEMQQQEQASEETTDDARQDNREPDELLDADTARQMLSYGLWAVEVSVGGVFDVPFQIEEPVGNKWLDASVPMLQKYGPAGLEWFGKYQGELMFAMASCSLIGGSALQVRRLRQEKIINEAKAAKEQHDNDAKGETDETAESSEQE